jgi:copper resistance protein B
MNQSCRTATGRHGNPLQTGILSMTHTELTPLALGILLAINSAAYADDNKAVCPPGQTCELMDHGQMNHSGMDHSGMDHSGMDHSGMDHSGMDHSGMDHSGMDHSGMDHSGMDHSGMDHSGMDHAADGHAGMDPSRCPAIKGDHTAVNHDMGNMNHDMAAMQGGKAPANARDPHAWSGGFSLHSGPYIPADAGHLHLMDSHSFSALVIDHLEQGWQDGNNRQHLAGEYWYGRTWDRAVLTFDADRASQQTDAELGLYWQHAVSTFWNTRLGMRHDSRDELDRTWIGAGFEGLAPYWFETKAMLYVAEEGVMQLHLETEYDMLFSQRLILQPAFSASLYNKEDPHGEFDIGLGQTRAALRLRYEISRQFAPYVGVQRTGHYGGTAALLGERANTQWLAGVKAWF